MSDVSFTADEAYWTGSESHISTKLADENIAVGQAVYLTSAGSLYRCDADGAAAANCIGIALASASSNQYVPVATEGLFNFGSAVLTVGTVYCVSPNNGMICPWADLQTGDYVTIIGVAETTSSLRLGINATGIAKA